MPHDHGRGPFLAMHNAPGQSLYRFARVTRHPRHSASVNSPRKVRSDHNSVYLRPTVVVSEGFRNLSVVLGNFRTARLVKPASAARLASRRTMTRLIDRRAIRSKKIFSRQKYYLTVVLREKMTKIRRCSVCVQFPL